MASMIYTLERTTRFLSEKRSELYKRYCSRVSQLKNALCAKNDLQGRTCFGLERRGV